MPMSIKQALGEIPSYQRRIIALLDDPENFVPRLRKEIMKPLVRNENFFIAVIN